MTNTDQTNLGIFQQMLSFTGLYTRLILATKLKLAPIGAFQRPKKVVLGTSSQIIHSTWICEFVTTWWKPEVCRTFLCNSGNLVSKIAKYGLGYDPYGFREISLNWNFFWGYVVRSVTNSFQVKNFLNLIVQIYPHIELDLLHYLFLVIIKKIENGSIPRSIHIVQDQITLVQPF